jgi:dethiobiotin synthetase
MVTGTDTGIGKTWVTCRLVEELHARGTMVRAVKLLETGTAIEPAETEDGVRLARAAGQSQPPAALRRYRAPLTPADAARLEGEPVELAPLEAEMVRIASEAEITLVEGAGGLLAPLNYRRTLLDIARRHDTPVLVVAADRLGTLNHTLLTLSMLDFSGVYCLGVVMNRLPEADAARDASVSRNAAMLHEVRPGTPLVETAHPGWEATVLGWLRA